MFADDVMLCVINAARESGLLIGWVLILLINLNWNFWKTIGAYTLFTLDFSDKNPSLILSMKLSSTSIMLWIFLLNILFTMHVRTAASSSLQN